MNIAQQATQQTLFQEIIVQLERDAVRLNKEYQIRDSDSTSQNLIDINRFIKVLYTLFDINGLLLNSQSEDGVAAGIQINQPVSPIKFLFSEEYPDDKPNDRDIVTFEILKRIPASLSASEPPFSGTKQYRPMYRGTSKNIIDNCDEANLMVLMDNQIRLTCWSASVKQAHRIARLLEQTFAKYHWFLRRFCSVIIFMGQDKDSKATDKYGPLRYYPIYLDYFIRTTEVYSLSEKEVKLIEINMNNFKSLLTDDSSN